MKIQTVRIKNFRALKDVTIEFDSITTFIGPNGVGKSTVLRALDWFFNGKPGDLTVSDFYLGISEDRIEVSVTFCGIDDLDRQALKKYAPVGVDTFTALKYKSEDGSEVLSANAKGFTKFNEIKTADGAKNKRALYDQLRASEPDLGLPPANSSAKVDEALYTWETKNPGLLEDSLEILETNFFGFNGDGKMSERFNFVFVAADLRASEESVDGKNSIIGRILERSVNREAVDEEIARLTQHLMSERQEIYDRGFGSQLTELNSRLNLVMNSYSTGRSVLVKPTVSQIKSPRTTFDLTIFDGHIETPVGNQGHGFQRTLLVSALQILAESKSSASSGQICLAIEEPELFQHPIQAQTFARVLRGLAEDDQKQMQIAYATHSPYFLEPQHFHQIRRLTRTIDETPVVEVYSASLGDLQTRLGGITDPASIGRQLYFLTNINLSPALFATRALLVEGTTECGVFYGLGDRSSPAFLEAEGTAVVSADGKDTIPLAHAILDSLGIPTYVVFDSDAKFRTRSKCKTVEQLEEEADNHSSKNRKLLKYLGLDQEDFPPEMVGAHVAIFEDHLETFLETNWPAWNSARDEVRQMLGFDFKKNQVAYRLTTKNAQGEVPTMLSTILDKVSSL